MDIYGQDQGSHQSARFDGKRRRSGGSELSRLFAEARRSGACADETQYGTILAAKIVLFLLGIRIKCLRRKRRTYEFAGGGVYLVLLRRAAGGVGPYGAILKT